MLNRFLKEIDTGSRSGIIKKDVIHYCLKNGKLTIPEIAKELNYSVPTITKYITEMCEDGLMCDYGKIESKEGRHPNVYGANADSCYFIGVDIKWFSVNIGLMNFMGEMVETRKDSKYRFDKSEEGLEDLCKRISNFISSVSVDKNKILNVNINISGRVNPESGYSYSIYNFGETPLSEIISRKIGKNVTIENDSRAMTYGEYFAGHYEEKQNMIFVNMGWGLGIGIIIDGKIYYGHSGFSGEFGHMSVFENEILCHCGKKGCLETEVSGSALHRIVMEKIKEGSLSSLSEKAISGKSITLQEIIDAVVEKEDMLCIELIEEMGQKLGKQLANLINVLNPNTVVIGGSLSEVGDYILQPIKTAVRKYSLNLINKNTNITISKLQDKAGVIGACYIARRRIFGE